MTWWAVRLLGSPGQGWDEGAGCWMTAGGLWLLGASRCDSFILVPKGGRGGGPSPSSDSCGVLGCCSAPHHPPSPTSHTLVPPPRQEMRTGFFVLPAEAPQRSRFLRGTTSPPGTQPPPSLYPTCATSCPQGRDRGAEPPLQGQPHSPCPTLVLGPVPLPVRGPVLFKVPRVMA